MLNLVNKKQVLEEANYFIKEEITLRELSKIFHRSKSAIHKDFTSTLSKINPEIQNQVKKKLENHKNTRHFKGGEATKRKYK